MEYTEYQWLRLSFKKKNKQNNQLEQRKIHNFIKNLSFFIRGFLWAAFSNPQRSSCCMLLSASILLDKFEDMKFCVVSPFQRNQRTYKEKAHNKTQAEVHNAEGFH